MANELRLKRRISGNAGAPAALKSAEPAMNFVDDTLYIGKGDDGSGNATTIIPLAGPGAFVDKTSAQTIAGKKTFSSAPESSQDGTAANDLVRKSQVDTALAGKAPVSHNHSIANITSLQATLDSKAAIASPALTGTPTAPTASAGTNTTQIATTAFVQAAVTAGTIETLGAIEDVTITSIGTGEILKWDGSKWVNQTLAEAGIAPSSHGHNAADITSGTLPVARGGTGATSASAARTSLGLAIGSDVQAYSGVLAATTASFTTSDEAKIDRITVTQAVNLDDIEARVNALDAAVVLKGTFDPSGGAFPGGGSAQAGESWIASANGTINGVEFKQNDRIICVTDNASATVYAGNWHKADYTDEVQSVAGKTGAVVLTAADISSGTFNNARIAQSNVTQHQGALSITESQISNLKAYLTSISGQSLGNLGDVTITSIASGELLKWNGSAWVNQTLAEAGIAAASHGHSASQITSGTFANARIAASNVTQHQAALSISNSQVSGLGSMSTQAANNVAITGGSIDNIALDCGTF
tara:strand:- start:2124 stop:3716 length:1593 start_codon:yes stop_codon:yes gene_type:complete